jgi:hypothetical protein
LNNVRVDKFILNEELLASMPIGELTSIVKRIKQNFDDVKNGVEVATKATMQLPTGYVIYDAQFSNPDKINTTAEGKAKIVQDLKAYVSGVAEVVKDVKDEDLISDEGIVPFK